MRDVDLDDGSIPEASTPEANTRPRVGSALPLFLAWLLTQALAAPALLAAGAMSDAPLAYRAGKLISAAVLLGIGFALLSGPRRREVRQAVGLVPSGLGTCLLCLAAGALLMALRNALAAAWPGDSLVPASEYTALDIVTRPPWHRVLFAADSTIIAPVTEEFLFRGYMLAGLRASWGPVAAGVVTSVSFVAVHYPAFLDPPLLLGFCAFAAAALAIRLRTGSLWPAIALHTGANGMIVLSSLL